MRNAMLILLLCAVITIADRLLEVLLNISRLVIYCPCLDPHQLNMPVLVNFIKFIIQ